MTGEHATSPAAHEAEISRLVAIARQKGTPDAYEGKRRWVRYAIGMKLEATRSPEKPWTSWSVITHSISGGGIGFWSKHKLTVKSRISVREWTRDNSAVWLPALVTHCAVGIRGYLIGAAFDDPRPPDGDTDTGATPVTQTRDGTARTAAAPSILGCRSLGTKCACASALAGSVGVITGNIISSHVGPAEKGLWVSIAAVLLAAGLAGLIGWVVVRSDVRFLNTLRRAVREIARGESARSSLAEAPSRQLAELHQAFLALEALWRQHEDDGRVRRHKLEELNQIKSNVLSIVSHDLRTPLTSILLYAQMLSDELDTLTAEDQRRFLGIISDECSRLARLVDDLLEVQRLESGKARWDLRPQDLSQTIAACAHVFEAMALSKSIQLEVDCPEPLPPVEADSAKISQVLSNLLSNALKYTPSGGTVRLSAQSNANEILIRVADTGPGIPQDKWDRIFGRFAQLSNPDTREIAGVGLGLYIVRQIVERHGGAVWVDSKVGRGSEFFVSLPVKAATPKTDSPTRDVPGAGRVLVCDADPELAAIISQSLRAQGFHVRVAHSGCRLLAQLEQGDTDVVVTDVLIPDMDAPELLDALDAVSPRSFKLIIHSFAGDGPELRRRGVDVFLQRPASKNDLIQAVQIAMRKQRTRGLTVLVVAGDGDQAERLSSALSKHGHLPIAAKTISEAAHRIRDYPLDLVLLAEETLGGDWARLERLGIPAESRLPIMILCETARRKKRQLADAYGAQLIPVRHMMEADVIDAIAALQNTVVTQVSP